MKIKYILFLFILLFYLQAEDKLVVGYYPAWSRYNYPAESIDFERVTHLIHAFAWPRADGSLDSYSSLNYPELITKAHAKDRKVLVAIGGWGNCENFSPLLSDSTSRTVFINNLVDFCVERGYDGVDIDWEYPSTQADKRNLVSFVRELSKRLEHFLDTGIVSIAVPAGAWSGSRFDYESMIPYLNWFGCMSYDFHGSWTNHAGHNSPLHAPSSETDGSVDNAINYLIQRKIPLHKILVGIPFYGRSFNTSGLYQSSTGGDGIAYREITKKVNNGWTRHWDDLAKVPYLINDSGTKLITYDDTLSVRYKCEYVNNKNLGGVMVWSIDQDYDNGKQPLLSAIQQNLNTTTDFNEEVPMTIDSFKIENIYPNPFNSTCNLKWTMQKKSIIKIEIYNLKGSIVKRMHLGKMNMGQHQLQINFDGLPSGTYLLVIKSDIRQEISKILYLK